MRRVAVVTLLGSTLVLKRAESRLLKDSLSDRFSAGQGGAETGRMLSLAALGIPLDLALLDVMGFCFSFPNTLLHCYIMCVGRSQKDAFEF